MQDQDIVQEWQALDDAFAVVEAMIRARALAGLNQTQVAEPMGSPQSATAKIESGHSFRLRMLKRYAQATGTKLKIDFVEAGARTWPLPGAQDDHGATWSRIQRVKPRFKTIRRKTVKPPTPGSLLREGPDFFLRLISREMDA